MGMSFRSGGHAPMFGEYTSVYKTMHRLFSNFDACEHVVEEASRDQPTGPHDFAWDVGCRGGVPETMRRIDTVGHHKRLAH